MTIDEAIIKAMTKATRKKQTTDDLGPKHDALLEAADTLQKTWETERDWSSRRELVSLGTVTATDTFELDDSIRDLSLQEGDYVTITNGTQTYYYDMVPAERVRFYNGGMTVDDDRLAGPQVVSRIGRNIVFSRAFTTTDPQLGGTLKVPAFTYVDDITDDGSQDVQ